VLRLVRIRPHHCRRVTIATVMRACCDYEGAHPIAITPMTSEQAAQLIDQTLALVDERLQDLQREALGPEQRALAAEFREWSDPAGGRIDLMICPGLAGG
jgi:hypothetical protein